MSYQGKNMKYSLLLVALLSTSSLMAADAMKNQEAMKDNTKEISAL